MRIVIAPDKFKASLTAVEAAEAMKRGVLRACPSAQLDLAPMADGGEGTVDALVAATNGTFHEVHVQNPLGEDVNARFGRSADGVTAFLEMAAAAGLALVPLDRRDPSQTTTRGVGDLLLAAASTGTRRIVMGIGGSATNDGGAGMADALGYTFLDRQGVRLHPVGGDLDRIDRIDPTHRNQMLDGLKLQVACDVDNPLCGPRGASAVYGPQKGATPEMVARLDRNLAHLAALIQRDLGIDVADVPGAGAAGGLGAGLIAFAHARLKPGAQLLMEAIDLPRRLAAADLCLTGEGAIDRSTGHGKVVAAVGLACRQRATPCIALAGNLGDGADVVLDHGISAYFSLCPGPRTLQECITEAADLLQSATEQAVRAFLTGRASADERPR